MKVKELQITDERETHFIILEGVPNIPAPIYARTRSGDSVVRIDSHASHDHFEWPWDNFVGERGEQEVQIVCPA